MTLRFRLTAGAALVVFAVSAACRPAKRQDARADAAAAAAPAAVPGPAAGAATAVALAAPAPPARRVVLRADHDRGVPLHPAPRDRAVSAHLADRSAVDVLGEQENGHWLHVRAADGTDGWLIDKYVANGARTATPGATSALAADVPLPGGACPSAAPPAAAVFSARAPEQSASAAGAEPAAAARSRLVVVSYNLWELYDGRGGDDYLAGKEHPESATLDEAHVVRRVAALAGPLRPLGADVLVFQEVESAELACALAHAAAPEASWTCWAASWAHEPHPQNVAVAARVAGTVVQLDPGPGMGQRGALEFSLTGAALRIAAVHLKSSVGATGIDDCGNAAKRMAVAYGLLQRQRELPDAAYLVLGDFNVDPADAAKVDYDRTDDLLAAAGDEDLVARFVTTPDVAAANPFHTIIDRAFLRPGDGVAADALRFALDAPTGGWASDHRPLVVTLRLGPVPAPAR
jgi:endonuclease/exonuclease/phosphatase family metal-dependent hydrolase